MEPGSRKAGVVWHTQGSGKSISMVCYAGKLLQQPEMNNPTLVVVTDRNDLDGQLFQHLLRGRRILLKTHAGAGGEPRGAARDAGRRGQSGGIIFTTVQKFSLLDGRRASTRCCPTAPTSSSSPTRRTAASTACRAVLDKKTGKYEYGFAKHMRDALPNASFIGFTGTPIALEDKDTRAVFGDYVSIYDIQDAVDDGATVPIYYESRLAKLDINQAEIDAAQRGRRRGHRGRRGRRRREKTKSEWAALEKLVGAEPRLEQVAADLVEHFETRSAALEGKAMIVA